MVGKEGKGRLALFSSLLMDGRMEKGEGVEGEEEGWVW